MMEEFVTREFGGVKLVLVDQTLVRAGGHYLTYNRSLMYAARDLGLQPWILASNMLDPELSAMPNVLPVFSGSWHTPHGPVAPLAPSDATLPQILPFASELMLGLRRLRARREDHVFIHTVGFYEVVELHRELLQSDVSALPTIHILCRRDLDEAPVGSEGRVAFEYAVQGLCRMAGLGLEVRFYTDTPELSLHYSEQTGVRFVTLPLPFGIDILQTAMESRAPERENRTLTQVCYLGDARDEKGYQHIPAAIDGLPTGLRQGQMRFVLQSNFNTPGGEPQVARARTRLQAMPRSLVDLRLKPLSDPAYFDVLAGSDATFITYDETNYARRSSGVFTESLYAGVIPIVPAGTSMANQLPKGFPTIYENVQELPGIVAGIHLRKRELKAEIARVAERWRELHSPTNLILQMLCAPRPALLKKGEVLSRDAFEYGVQVSAPPEPAPRPERPPTCMHVLDLESLYWRIGAGYVKRLQAEALVGQGVLTFAVMVVHQVLDETADDPRLRPSYWARQATLMARELGYAGHWVVFRRSNDAGGKSGIRGELAQRSHVMSSEGLMKFLCNVTPDFVYSNYAQNYPTMQRCGLSTLPFIVETHDVQAHHAALYDKESEVEADAKAELAVYSQARAVSCLTEPDALYMRENGISVVEHCLPLIAPREADESAFAGLQDLGEMMSASGSTESTVDIQKAWASGQTHQLMRLFSETRMNMLFVGGWHKPNIEGLKWFYDEVFQPYLEPAGKNAFVYGGIFPEKVLAPSDRIFWAGRCESLDLAYASAEIVIAPLLQGTGVNIKVLEALAWGKPVVATSVALRGIHGAKELLGAFDDPEAFARRVLALSDKPALRQEASRMARKVYQDLMARNDYHAHVRKLVAHVSSAGGRALANTAAPRVAASDARSSEWSHRRTHIARYIRAVLEGGTSPSAFGRVLDAIASASDLDGLMAELTSLYETRKAFALTDRFLGSCLRFPDGETPRSAKEAFRWLLLRGAEDIYTPLNADFAMATSGSRTISDAMAGLSTSTDATRVRAFEDSTISGVERQVQSRGFDFLIWNGHNGVGEMFTSWLVREVIAAEPGLRDASILVVGGRASTAFSGLNIVHLEDAERIDPLALVARTLILPSQGIYLTHPHWLRAALVFQAAGKRVLSPDLGFVCGDADGLSLGQDRDIWTDAMLDALGAQEGVRDAGPALVDPRELRAMAPRLGVYLAGLGRFDLDWSPAHAALGAALAALTGGEPLTPRQERDLRQRADKDRFADHAAAQIEHWISRAEASRQIVISPMQLSRLSAEPTIANLLDILAEAARTDWVKPSRRRLPARSSAALIAAEASAAGGQPLDDDAEDPSAGRS